jgi:hypothetical protein
MRESVESRARSSPIPPALEPGTIALRRAREPGSPRRERRALHSSLASSPPSATPPTRHKDHNPQVRHVFVPSRGATSATPARISSASARSWVSHHASN